MRLFDDVLRPQRGALFQDLLDPPPIRRGDFGLGTAETIGPIPSLRLQDVVPRTLETGRHLLSSLLHVRPLEALRAQTTLAPSLGVDLLNAAFAPVSAAMESGTRALQGRPQLPLPSLARGALTGFPEDDPFTATVRAALEMGAVNAAPAAARGVGRAISRLGVTGRLQQTLRARQILTAPVEALVSQAQRSGGEAADILRALRRGRSPKFRPVFEAVQQQRQAPRRIAGLLPAPLASERGAAGLPEIRPGDFVRFGNQVRRVVSLDPRTQRVVLAVTAGRTITVPLRGLTRTTPVAPEGQIVPQAQPVMPSVPKIVYVGQATEAPVGKRVLYVAENPSYAKRFGETVTRVAIRPKKTLDVTPLGERSIGFETLQTFLANHGVTVDVSVTPYEDDAAKPAWQWIRKFPDIADDIQRVGYDAIQHKETFRGTGKRETTYRILDQSILQPTTPAVAPGKPMFSSAGAMADPGYVLKGQPFEGVIISYEKQAGLGTFDRLSPKAQLEVIANSPEAAPVQDIIKKVTGQVKTGRPVAEAVALRRLFQREAAVARQAFRAGRVTALEPIPPTTLERVKDVTGQIPPPKTLSEQQALTASLRRQQTTTRRAALFSKAQTLDQIGNLFSEPKKFLKVAQAKSLTPIQVGRMARLQRIQVGQITRGPRGGVLDVPLTAADLRRIEAATEGIVPRQPQISGQPPRIPRTQALVPADFAQHPFRDLTEFQAAPLSGLDPRRAARLVDGQDFGPVRQVILDPAQAAAQAGRAAGQRDLAALHRVVPTLRPVSRLARGPQESEQLFDLIEGRLDPTAITPRVQQAAGIMRETYDRLLGDLNAARQRQGKVPIQRREHYITHIQTLNVLDDFYYGLNNVPEEALGLPSVTTHPNSPFFQFALKRLGGPYAKDAVEAFTRYVMKANAVIAHAPVLQATRPLIRFLPPRAQGYFTQYLDEVLALKKAKADVMVPRPLLNAVSWLRRQVGGGAILGNLSSVFNQLWTVPAIVARVGPVRAVGAGGELLAATGTDVLNRLILRVGARDYAQAILDLHKPTVRDFIDQHSPLMQNRRFEIEFDPTTMRRVDKVLGALIQSVDQEMVRLAWLAQFRKSARAGTAFAHAVREAEETAFVTQSGYTPEDLPPAFRSQIAGAFAQFQNSVNNVFNFLRFDVGIQPLTLARDFRGHVGRHPQLFKQALLFFGTVLTMKMLYEHAGIPSAVDGPEDLIPLWGMAEYGPPAFWAPADAVLSLATADTPLERAKATAKFKRAAFLLIGRGGNQLRKTMDGIVGISKGGKFDRRGRLLFPVRGTIEQGRALLFGIYGTQAGQAYIRRGFKPEPKRFQLTAPQPTLARPALGARTNGRIIRRGHAPVRGRLFEDVLSK